MLFSFSDLWEHLRDFWNATLKPSWKNLLSEKQNTLNLFTVILILETLLCVLFLSFANNLAITDAIRESYGEFRDTVLTDENKTAVQSALSSLNAHVDGMEGKNTAVFVFAATVWFLTSFFIFTKIIASSVELKKFVYGLYIVFGANTKKIRGFIFCQMMTLGLVSLLPSMGIAALICSQIYGFVSYSALSAGQVLPLLVCFAAMLIAVIAVVARRLTATSCVSLLAASDVSNMVKSPKKSLRWIYPNKPFRMARIALKRMRGHYLPMIVSASLPACLFFCCMSLAVSNEARNADTVKEYTLVYTEGLGGNSYRNGLRPALLNIQGIAEALPNAADTADNQGVHMLLTGAQASRQDSLVACHGGIAYADLKIISADYFSLREKNVFPKGATDGFKGNSFEIIAPAEGSALLIYPDVTYGNHNEPYQRVFTPADGTAFLAYPNSDAAGLSPKELLAASSHHGFSVTLSSKQVNSLFEKKYPYGFLNYRLDEELLVLNPVDYERLTGIKVTENIKQGLPSPIFTLSELGSYLTVSDASLKAGVNSAPAESLYASNGFVLDVGDEFSVSKYGLPSNTVLPTEQGCATLVRSWNSYVSNAANTLLLSHATHLKLDPEDPETLMMTQTDRLRMIVDGFSQYYSQLTLVDVVYSTEIQNDILLLNEYDLAEICLRDGVYREVELTVAADIPPAELAQLLTDLHLEVSNPSLNSEIPTLAESGELWNAITVGNCHYNAIARALAVILLLAVPFIWFCPQFNFYSKRKSDLEILCAIGQPRSMLLKIMICEGILLALRSAAVSLLLCPLFTVATFEFLKFNGFPFAYSSLDPWALVAVLIYSAVCAFGASVINYPILFAHRRQNRFDPNETGKEFL